MDEAAETGADAAVEHADRAVVDGDPIALKRLVTNLVDNALKFGSSAHAAACSPTAAWRWSRSTTTVRAMPDWRNRTRVRAVPPAGEFAQS